MAVSSVFTGAQMTSWSQLSPGLQADYRHCRAIMRQASKNYSFASRFIPLQKLHHVEALYAFLRVGDDRVDVSHHGFNSPQEALQDWERLYWHAFETGTSPHPVLRAYLHTAQECQIPAETMSPYFRAMKEDLMVTRFETFADLLHYMEGSAMTVGRSMTHILGVRPPHAIAEALPYADALSIAMQLSNFWRDIAYDWSIGRVYLPQEDLLRFAVSEADLAAHRLTSQFIELMQFEIERTESYYRQARQGVPLLATGQWGVQSGLEIYRAILTAIQRNHYNVFHKRLGASRPEKAILAVQAWWATRKR